MRLVQKSLLHTGYFITQDENIIPSFTNDLVTEAMMHPKRSSIKSMYGVLRKDEISYLCTQIRNFRRKYGIIPQNLTEFIRTGFATKGNLKQAHNRFIYK